MPADTRIATAGFLSDALGVQTAQIVFRIVCTVGGIGIYSAAGEFRRARIGARTDLAASSSPSDAASPDAVTVEPAGRR